MELRGGRLFAALGDQPSLAAVLYSSRRVSKMFSRRRKELRKKREIEAGGREEKSPGMENSPPGIQELLDMMDYDAAAEWQQICDDLREKELKKKQKRDEMKCGGPEA